MKMKNNKLLLLLILLVAVLPGAALAKQFSGTNFPNPPTAESHPNILFVGNSLTYMNGDMPEVLAALCKTMNIRCCINEHTVGGCTLARFANPAREGQNLETVLKKGVWDCVVLQGNSVEAISAEPMFAELRPAVITLDKKIKQYNPNCKTVLFSTVAHVDTLEKTAEIYANYKKVGAEIGAMVVPCGPAWLKLGPNNDRKKIEFLFATKTNPKDRKHPSPYGALLNAYVFYGALFGKDPKDIHVAVAVNGKPAEAKIADRLKAAAQQTLIECNLLKPKDSK